MLLLGCIDLVGEAVYRRMRLEEGNRAPSNLFEVLLAGELCEGDIPRLTADAWTMCEYPTRVEEPHIWLAMFHRIGYRNAAGAGLTAPTRSFLYRGASIRFHHENICGLDIVNRPASRT